MANLFNSTAKNKILNIDTSLLVFRVLIPFTMIYNHGFGKVMNVINGNLQWRGDPFDLPVGISLILAAFAEGICSLLIILGFYTRLAALLVVINMLVALLFYHVPAGDFFGGLELPFIYFVAYLFIFLAGPGKYSVNNVGNKRSY